MKWPILKRIRKKTNKIIDHQLLRLATVLEVRSWPGSPMQEIDLHLPESDMRYWMAVPYIKFHVGGFIFRDYTPFGWDAGTSTCSLLIDLGHQGPGSKWAKALRAGVMVQYIITDSSRQQPHPTNLVVGLGDNSSIGHLMALRQLTIPNIRFDGAFVADSAQTGNLLNDYFDKPLIPHSCGTALITWLEQQAYCTAHTSFYLTGNEDLLIRLQKVLKELGHSNICVRTFWS